MTGSDQATRTSAVLLAGGTGARFGAGTSKHLARFAGSTLIEHTINAFDSSPQVDDITIVMPASLVSEVESIAEKRGYRKVSRVLEAGADRLGSTYRALTTLGLTDERSYVLLHEAARPLVDQRVISACVRALRTHAAVSTAVPASDTVLEVDGDVIATAPDRERLRRAQTPQGFWLPTLREACERALAEPGFTHHDDCATVLHFLPEVAVHIVPGSEANIKITYPGDITLAETLLRLGPGGHAEASGNPEGAQSPERSRE